MDIQITKQQASAAFTEWEREYREEPEKFMSRAERLTTETASYGEKCSATFLDYLERTKPA